MHGHQRLGDLGKLERKLREWIFIHIPSLITYNNYDYYENEIIHNLEIKILLLKPNTWS